jgi:hypothetical protein
MDVDAEKSRNIFGSHEENAGKYHNAKTDNKSLEGLGQIRY